MMRGLDTYYGRRLISIEKTDDGWSLELDGGVKIISHDKSKAPNIPSDLVESKALLFSTLILDSTATQLVFHSDSPAKEEWRIKLNAVRYQIFDPSVQDESYAPQQPVERQPPSVYPVEREAPKEPRIQEPDNLMGELESSPEEENA